MDARTRFLSTAAHTYARAAPATSAHLQLCSDELSAITESRLHTHSFKGACASCGSIFIPGLNSRIIVVDPQAKIPGDRSSGPAVRTSRKERTDLKPKAPPKVLRYQCTRCRRYMENTLPKLEHHKSSVQHKEKPTVVQLPDYYVTSSVTIVDKRPRNRRKGGLKALLAEVKGTAGPSSSLDLMDFMKSA